MELVQWSVKPVSLCWAASSPTEQPVSKVKGHDSCTDPTPQILTCFTMVEYSLDLQNVNFTAIRTVRVLRPLKAINRVPSMRILVNLLLDTLPMLGNVLLLCFFVFFIFGIIGVQLWAGLLRNRCYPEHNFTL
uniref:Ion transport domain-containing protein n=1 Tax=Knipowitschia caucasica TaxID=637954 RepID=A0AAV2LQQ2_KNICA